MNGHLKLSMTRVELADPASVQSIRLVGPPGKARLLHSTTRPAPGNASRHQTVISSTPIEPGAATTPVLTLDQLLPIRPYWDALADEDASIGVVYERAEGAINSIHSSSKKAVGRKVSSTQRFESFALPRFVRGDGSVEGKAVSTIRDAQNAVAFAPAGAAGYGPAGPICESQDAVLVSLGREFAIFYKMDGKGPIRGEKTLPGALYAALLDGDFRLKQPGVPLFAEERVYEMDAALVPGSGVAVFATLEGGWIVAIGNPGPKGFEVTRMQRTRTTQHLVRPCIVSDRSALRTAFLELRSQGPQIWTGHATL